MITHLSVPMPGCNLQSVIDQEEFCLPDLFGTLQARFLAECSLDPQNGQQQLKWWDISQNKKPDSLQWLPERAVA